MTSSMTLPSTKLFLLLFTRILFSPSILSQFSYLHHGCSTNKTFAASSASQSDPATLLSSFASANTDFYNFTVASSGDIVCGLFMCRSDVILQVYRQCVVKATQRLPSECRFSKEAVIWYNECMLRYSNRSFFSTVDTGPSVSLLDAGNASRQSSLQLMWDTLNFTAEEAAKDAKKYATREATISWFKTVYSLFQCTPDRSSQYCRRCLRGVIGDLGSCCNGKQGGSVLYPSCNFRYELYAFHPSEAASVPPTNTTASLGKGGMSSGMIVAIVVLISVVVLIFIVGICCLIKRLRKKYNSKSAIDISNLDSLQYDFRTIEAATNKFSEDNKLGKGAFGVVYKGKLPNGQEIAVKRLYKSSSHGTREFKNEVEVLAKVLYSSRTFQQ